MKYLLLIYGNQEKWASIPADQFPAEIAKQDAFNKKYAQTGELIGAYGLADAAAARLVRRENGQPAVTDGPYLETKEYIASFYLLDCESEERALAIAAEMPWADVEPVEFWAVLHEAAQDVCLAAGKSRTCCGSWRRRSSPPWSGGTGSSTCARTPARKRYWPRRCSGRPAGSRRTRAAGSSPSAPRASS